MASIMNSVPAEHRGAASGMRATIQNSAIDDKPSYLFHHNHSVAQRESSRCTISCSYECRCVSAACTGLQFYASLRGPLRLISRLQPSRNDTSYASFIVSKLHTKATINYLTGSTFFPNAISAPFMTALREAFIIGAIMCIVAAVCSALRGGKYVYGSKETHGKRLEVLHPQHFFKRHTCK